MKNYAIVAMTMKDCKRIFDKLNVKGVKRFLETKSYSKALTDDSVYHLYTDGESLRGSRFDKIYVYALMIDNNEDFNWYCSNIKHELYTETKDGVIITIP